ncbi:DMT family transporter [Rugosimonospora africana]|uniref:MFS transporter n=1 Tax=Rugosimonospora africana TaxID=556532 RepID=A0A8J3QXZ7_9ACTN|nr:DMT family transporter [Rugosimonospora africana]GIH18167.1 hypothetical protein Raf01_63390 [Rugosimonospora africana]
MPTPRTGSPVARSYGHRLVAAVAAVFFAATGVLFWPSAPASAAPPSLGDQCSVQDWQNPTQWDTCVGKLTDLTADEAQCVEAPTPEAPDSGMAGWFATRPNSAPSDADGMFTNYGYAGYDYSTYDSGCVNIVRNPDSEFENTVANGEFMFATGVIGASDALRDKAWDPQSLWGWADTLVTKATKAVYTSVFTVFGGITLAVVGLYLLWRSRQSDMNNAMTTAGWAILVMVAVTAIARWPVSSAHLADQSLVSGLSTVHSAVGPPTHDTPSSICGALPDTEQCKDHRPPSQRASDVAVTNLLYRNWLRGELGSADSTTAKKYGFILYDSKSLTWGEAQSIKNDPSGKIRQQIISEKQVRWEKVARQIKTEDPDAYQYLQGNKGMDRVGAGFIAILSAVFFAMFDIVASVLVLLGFLIFRWAVIAAPVLGTVGMLRPASTGIRRLANAVVAAIFNIIIFGTGAAIYLFAVDLIMGTATLPAWLQVVLVWLCGIVGWLLLRPYRRITQLGGGRDATGQVAAAGSWHRTFFRDLRQAATLGIAAPAVESAVERRRRDVTVATTLRPEARHEDPVEARGSGGRPDDRRSPGKAVPSRSPQWKAPDRNEGEPAYAVYRPDSAGPRTADPVQRPESAPIRG